MNLRLAKANPGPCTADRVTWAEVAVANFARAADSAGDLSTDSETVLTDLLADLMHWCDAQNCRPRVKRHIEFESALARARKHYKKEIAERITSVHGPRTNSRS